MSVEGPGGLAGALARPEPGAEPGPEPGEDGPKLPGSVRRRTWRAVALAVVVVLGVLGGAGSRRGATIGPTTAGWRGSS